jgi:hypothetical protein
MLPEEDIEKRLHKFLNLLREGLPLRRCVDLAGFTQSEMNAMRRVPEIEQAIVEASTEKERAVLNALLLSAVQGNTDAGRWYLERRSADYMSINQRKTAKLAEDRWRMEKKIIKAELGADPGRVAMEANKQTQAIESTEEEEAEIIATGSESEED